jgi:hypothetical protein
MAINRTQVGTQPIGESYDVSIRMVSTQPDTDEIQNPTVLPNEVIGYYNFTLDVVELYIANRQGTRYLRVT